MTQGNNTLATIATDNGIQAVPSFDLIADKFLEAHDIAPKSKATYRRALRQFFIYLDEQHITQPSRTDLLAYKRYLIDKELSPHTVSAYIIALRKLFQWTESESLYPNIAATLKGQKKPKGFNKDALTVEQVRSLLTGIAHSSLIGARDYAIINLLVRTGLRTIEAERADIADIRQQGGQAVLYIQGKGRDSKDEIVILTEETLSPLRDYITQRRKLGKVKDSDPLFASHSDRNQSQRLTTRSISRIVKTHLAANGLDDKRLTAHSLRHTAVTFSLLGGATIQEAQGMARHANINTTLIYAHNLDRVGKAPERKIDALIGDLVNNVNIVNTKRATV